MPNIYYDITPLIGWKGALTGIPRTTDEIARRLRGLDSARFVSWEAHGKYFVEIDIDDYYTRIDAANRTQEKEISAHEVKTSNLLYLKKAISRTPILGRTAKKLNRVVKNKVNSYKNIESNLAKISPVAGDLVFVACGIWDDSNYIKTLLSYKANGVKLAFISHDMLPVVAPQFSGQWGYLPGSIS